MICPNCGYDNLPGSEECASCLQDLTHLDRPVPHNRIERSLTDEPVVALRPVKAISVHPTTTVREAISLLNSHNVGVLLVTDADERLVGVFSERDVLLRIVGLQANYDDLPVSQFMTMNPETVTMHDKLVHALSRMDGGGYRHLPVLDGEHPIGIISVRDFLRYIRTLCRDS
jgi:CBS domain-containing protein